MGFVGYILIVIIAVLLVGAVVFIVATSGGNSTYHPYSQALPDWGQWQEGRESWVSDEDIEVIEERWEREQAERRANQEAKQAAAILRWQESQQRVKADRAKKAEDFPAWLVSLGSEYGLTTYAEVAALRSYLRNILTYAQFNLNGQATVRGVYQAIDEGTIRGAPNYATTTKAFWVRAAQVLGGSGLLEGGRGRAPRKVAKDALEKLSIAK